MFWIFVCFGFLKIFILFVYWRDFLLFLVGGLFVFEGFCVLDLFLLFRCHVVTVT